MAADPIYDDEHPQLVASMIIKYIAPDDDSRALVALPIRDHYSEDKAEKFKGYMNEYGLDLLHQGEEEFVDADWRNANGDEADPVKCWWGIWGLRQ